MGTLTQMNLQYWNLSTGRIYEQRVRICILVTGCVESAGS